MNVRNLTRLFESHRGVCKVGLHIFPFVCSRTHEIILKINIASLPNNLNNKLPLCYSYYNDVFI